MSDAGRTPLIALLLGVVAAGLIWTIGEARAQDMEPRAYSANPIDTNFLLATYSRVTGSASLDPSLPISNVKGTINGGLIGYQRTFDLFGHQAAGSILFPYFEGNFSGQVYQAGMQATRTGLDDLRLRITENLIGVPALTPEEFARREPTTTVGISLTIKAPTGYYNPQYLINVGSNRWAFRPEIGVSQPIGNWFTDASAGVNLYTGNSNFFGGHVTGQEPLWAAQVHGGYNFRPGLWLAADATHYFGGGTTLDGINKHNFQSVTRYGATLSVPIGEGFSVKVAWSSWLSSHNVGGYDSFAFSLQYHWY
jgi:hypothetical protein